MKEIKKIKELKPKIKVIEETKKELSLEQEVKKEDISQQSSEDAGGSIDPSLPIAPPRQENKANISAQSQPTQRIETQREAPYASSTDRRSYEAIILKPNTNFINERNDPIRRGMQRAQSVVSETSNVIQDEENINERKYSTSQDKKGRRVYPWET